MRKISILLLSVLILSACQSKEDIKPINPIPTEFDDIASWKDINGKYAYERWNENENKFDLLDINGDPNSNVYVIIDNGVTEMRELNSYASYNYSKNYSVIKWLMTDISTGTLRRIESWNEANSYSITYGFEDCSKMVEVNNQYSVGAGYEFKLSKNDNCLYRVKEGEGYTIIDRLNPIESIPIGPCK